MKKITFATYLRPAIPSDVFNKDGFGKIIENKEFFYLDKNQNFIGPYREFLPFNETNLQRYKELFQAMSLGILFIVDPKKYSESIAIKLKVKQVEDFDILEADRLIVNTAYFIKNQNTIGGPFYINSSTKKSELYSSIKNRNFFVFDKSSKVKRFSFEKMVG